MSCSYRVGSSAMRGYLQVVASIPRRYAWAPTVRLRVAASKVRSGKRRCIAPAHTAVSGYSPRMTFRGIPPEALDFYARLEADNSKAFWEANKTVYRDVVKASVQALCDELAEYGPFHLFRPYNDVRFAKNRPPYKTQQGAYGESEGGTGHYFHISRTGLLAATGYYAMM